jgi:DNA-binding HxlR family transcriptional regulator
VSYQTETKATTASSCVANEILERLATKWTTLVIDLLAASPSARFTELKNAIAGISQKVLTQTLREMERNGLVSRKVYPVIPPRVEYTITPLGQTLREPLRILNEWAAAHIDEVREAQAAFDRRKSAQA